MIRPSETGTAPPEPKPGRALHGGREFFSRLAGRVDLPLLGIVVLAATLRLIELDRIGLRGDETVYVGQAGVLADNHELDRYFILTSRGNSNFLLYQEILSVVFRMFGVGDVTARIVSAVFSTLTVPVIYWIALTFFGRRSALFAALLFALSGYSISLGRLALLDSALVFFSTLTILCAVRLVHTGHPGWLYAMAATGTLTVQAKVTGVLALVVAVAYVAVAGNVRKLATPRHLLLALLTVVVCSVPVIIQLVQRWNVFNEFLTSSLRRSSAVPWYYYEKLLLSYEGAVVLALWVLGIVFAVVRRTRGDKLLLLWVFAMIAFYSFYPLKAFNYLLPVVPAVSILAGRMLGSASYALRRPQLRRLAPAVLTLAMFAAVFPTFGKQFDDRSYPGLREAAEWIAAESPKDAGVMVLSQGSAHYVFSYYAHRDSYPFGRFNLATVMPGGKIIPASAPKEGTRTPRDWVTDWPNRLITDGTVSYLVYYTPWADDPPAENQVVRTAVQRRLQMFVELYHGKLVHVEYRHHEARTWVYQLTTRRPSPVLALKLNGPTVSVTGKGFMANTPLTVTFNGKVVAHGRSDLDGAASVTLPMPSRIRPRSLLVVTDAGGRYASLVFPKPTISYRTDTRGAKVDGVGFRPNDLVTATYHGVVVARAKADRAGSVQLSFPVPQRIFPQWRLVVADQAGNYAERTLPAPTLRTTVVPEQVSAAGDGFTGNGVGAGR
ncbi:glycosyltransferase family 39 protein [Streptomyces sp. NPDC006197]|uniref:ArnT family glycosyltransferase n=1 Tax=Streptomyces sp. NPDC006197 TaxID=3156685 RepID=UPI0033A660CD